MASPQLEEGYLKIAFSLSAALAQAGFSALELQVILTVMNLTYGRNQTKAEMSIDDLRFLLGNRTNARTPRVEKVVNDLLDKNVLFKQGINQHRFILGLQKDFEKWGAVEPKSANSNDNVSSYNNNNTNQSSKLAKSSSVPMQLMEYVAKLTGVSYKSIMFSRLELGRANKLYAQALQFYRSPLEASWALRDYADYVFADQWARDNAKMPIALMGRDFERWMKALPKKTRDIEANEKFSGFRMRYNLRKREWEEVRAPVKRP